MAPMLEKFTDPLPESWRVNRLLVDFAPDGTCCGSVNVVFEQKVQGVVLTVAKRSFPLEKLEGDDIPNCVKDVVPSLVVASQASACKAEGDRVVAEARIVQLEAKVLRLRSEIGSLKKKETTVAAVEK